jgi:hypothetical protein
MKIKNPAKFLINTVLGSSSQNPPTQTSAVEPSKQADERSIWKTLRNIGHEGNSKSVFFEPSYYQDQSAKAVAKLIHPKAIGTRKSIDPKVVYRPIDAAYSSDDLQFLAYSQLHRRSAANVWISTQFGYTEEAGQLAERILDKHHQRDVGDFLDANLLAAAFSEACSADPKQAHQVLDVLERLSEPQNNDVSRSVFHTKAHLARTGAGMAVLACIEKGQGAQASAALFKFKAADQVLRRWPIDEAKPSVEQLTQFISATLFENAKDVNGIEISAPIRLAIQKESLACKAFIAAQQIEQNPLDDLSEDMCLAYFAYRNGVTREGSDGTLDAWKHQLFDMAKTVQTLAPTKAYQPDPPEGSHDKAAKLADGSELSRREEQDASASHDILNHPKTYGSGESKQIAWGINPDAWVPHKMITDPSLDGNGLVGGAFDFKVTRAKRYLRGSDAHSGTLAAKRDMELGGGANGAVGMVGSQTFGAVSFQTVAGLGGGASASAKEAQGINLRFNRGFGVDSQDWRVDQAETHAILVHANDADALATELARTFYKNDGVSINAVSESGRVANVNVGPLAMFRYKLGPLRIGPIANIGYSAAIRSKNKHGEKGGSLTVNKASTGASQHFGFGAGINANHSSNLAGSLALLGIGTRRFVSGVSSTVALADSNGIIDGDNSFRDTFFASRKQYLDHLSNTAKTWSAAFSPSNEPSLSSDLELKKYRQAIHAIPANGQINYGTRERLLPAAARTISSLNALLETRDFSPSEVRQIKKHQRDVLQDNENWEPHVVFAVDGNGQHCTLGWSYLATFQKSNRHDGELELAALAAKHAGDRYLDPASTTDAYSQPVDENGFDRP